MFPVRFIVAAAVTASSLHDASSFTATSYLRRPSSTTATTSSYLPRLHDRTTELNAVPPQDDDNRLHLLTFDLDDTIFPIGPVVADANVAQLRTLINYGYDGACNDEIIAASKRIRTELREAGDAKITYSDLRKRSVRREIERVTGTSDGAVVGADEGAAAAAAVHESVIEAVFDAWLSERHASADRNLFPNASNALESIKEEHPDAIVGAITNGRGDPLEMPSVREYFDFCVSGEDEGVFPRRKPDEGIYEAAVKKYEQLRGGAISPGADCVSFNWIHVGDDLSNDVGASAAVGAKTIWVKMEEEDAGLPSWSTATPEELRRREAMDEEAREFVGARIGSLEELPGAIAALLNR